MRRLLLVIVFLYATHAVAADDVSKVEVTVEPKVVYLERLSEGQALNFELVLKNGSDIALDIDRIEVSAFDAQDRLLLRRFVDGNGVRPSVQTLGERSVAAKQALAIFNPFHTFSSELPIGNHVVIDHGGGEFAIYAHAQQNSISLRPGQRVRQGDAIGRIGASGSAFFPHLHFQLQSGPDTTAEGLPSYFERFARVIGDRKLTRTAATVDTGEIVESQ